MCIAAITIDSDRIIYGYPLERSFYSNIAKRGGLLSAQITQLRMKFHF